MLHLQSMAVMHFDENPRHEQTLCYDGFQDVRDLRKKSNSRLQDSRLIRRKSQRSTAGLRALVLYYPRV